MAYFRHAGLMPPDPSQPDRVTVADLVVLLCHRTQALADRVWDMTVADIILSLREPERGQTATNQAEQIMICIMIDERRAMLDRLSLGQRVELAEWKAEFM